jgi:hypothetical protein
MSEQKTKLGELITDPMSGRDCIHIAVAPVVAAEMLPPGWFVRLNDRGEAETEKGGDGIGIVDPFLLKSVEPGERFWLCLFPGSITGLRHAWAHPAFARRAKP